MVSFCIPVGPHTFNIQSFSFNACMVNGASCSAKHFRAISQQTYNTSHHNMSSGVCYDQDLFDSQPPLLLLSPYIWAECQVWEIHHNTSQHDATENSHFPLFFFPAFPFLTPNSHFPLPNTYTSASNELLAERKSSIYCSVCKICLQELQKIYIYYIYSILLSLSILTGCMCPAVEGLQGVKVHPGSYSHSSVAELAATSSANRRDRG